MKKQRKNKIEKSKSISCWSISVYCFVHSHFFFFSVLLHFHFSSLSFYFGCFGRCSIPFLRAHHFATISHIFIHSHHSENRIYKLIYVCCYCLCVCILYWKQYRIPTDTRTISKTTTDWDDPLLMSFAVCSLKHKKKKKLKIDLKFIGGWLFFFSSFLFYFILFSPVPPFTIHHSTFFIRFGWIRDHFMHF